MRLRQLVIGSFRRIPAVRHAHVVSLP